jgi:uncharacterized peroxidase-related enzyme
MPFVRTISEAEAAGQLADLYHRLAYQDGSVDEAYRVLSLNPALLSADAAMYDTTMYGESPLSRSERELLALTVSRLNGCERCFRHHSARYSELADSKATSQVQARPTQARSEREGVLVAFAEKLTSAPAGITAADLEPLRRVGLDDRGVLDACNTVAYFNYANRMALGLGLAPRT